MSAEADRPPQRGGRINFNTVLAAACVLFSIFLFLVIPSEVERPPVLFGTTSAALDPAFFPRLVATCFLIVGLWYLRESFRLNDANGFRGLTRRQLVQHRLHHRHVRGLCVDPAAARLHRSRARSWSRCSASSTARAIGPPSTIVAIGVPAVVYVVFRRVLTVALPEFPDF